MSSAVVVIDTLRVKNVVLADLYAVTNRTDVFHSSFVHLHAWMFHLTLKVQNLHLPNFTKCFVQAIMY